MKFKNIRHIFFDLDHTLWDFDKNSSLAFGAIFTKHEINVELNEFLKIYSPINENYWALYRQDKVTKEDLRIGRLKESFDALKIEVSNTTIEALS
ncbi:noncanonical pyrimidine nucleotidase, YjjG family, partial [Tamlana crocina]|nr:noncanonical pyrimidine nucleotidase, YjjG family [Tamlana crocina]